MPFSALHYKAVERLLLAASLVCFGIAVQKFFEPRVPEGSGPWGWLDQFFLQLLGSRGPFVMWVVLGAILLVSCLHQRNKKSDQ